MHVVRDWQDEPDWTDETEDDEPVEPRIPSAADYAQFAGLDDRAERLGQKAEYWSSMHLWDSVLDAEIREMLRLLKARAEWMAWQSRQQDQDVMTPPQFAAMLERIDLIQARRETRGDTEITPDEDLRESVWVFQGGPEPWQADREEAS